MNFSLLEGFHSKWQDILVIGKTTEWDGKKYHIVGMTLSDEAKLYIIEPYIELESRNRIGIRNHRRMLKEHERRTKNFTDFVNVTERSCQTTQPWSPTATFRLQLCRQSSIFHPDRCQIYSP